MRTKLQFLSTILRICISLKQQTWMNATPLSNSSRFTYFLASAICLLTPLAQAAPGDLDTTFGGGGRVGTQIGTNNDVATCIAIQSDGKIVVGGHSITDPQISFALARYTTNGSLDTTFGPSGTGIVITPIGTLYAFGAGIALQSDGKILLAGYSVNTNINYDFALVRYLTNGYLDTSFGVAGTGIVTTPIGTNNDVARSIVIQGDGKIVVGGYSVTNGTNANFALVRYTTNGVLDAGTFGTGGKVTTDFSGRSDEGYSVALQSDGKIVLAGRSFNGNNYDFALARYYTDGILDTSFGTLGTGKVTTPIGSSNDYGRSVVVQTDGKIVVAGESFTAHLITDNYDFALVRYTDSGALDTNFGASHNGKVITDFTGYDDAGRSAVLQSDGKIVVAGYASHLGISSPERDFALARYDTFGNLDFSFNLDGKVITVFAGRSDDEAYGVALQSDGKIVVAGTAETSRDGTDFVLARYQWGAPEIVVEQPASTSLFDGGAIDFGTEFVGVSGAARTFTLRNTGVADLTLGTFTKSGANPNEFAANTNSTAAIVPAGGSTTFMVTFSPTGRGTRTAGLHITNNDSDENPFDINVSGTGSAGPGDLDPFFGTNGNVITDFGREDYGSSVALQSDNKIVVAGYSWNGNYNFALARYTANGGLDTSFGTDGKVTTDFVGMNDYASSVAIQGDGKILVAGRSEDLNGSLNFALARYTTNGVLDTSFGPSGSGKVTTDFSTLLDSAYSVTVQSDGKIVLAGVSANQVSHDFALARYTTNGFLDTTFGTNGNGKVLTDFNSRTDEGFSVAVQSDGKIVVAGSADSSSGGNRDFAIVRYTPNGALDPNFGTGGKVNTPIGSGEDIGRSVVVQNDGKIIVAGSADLAFGQTQTFALIRYTTNGALDGTFGAGGKLTTDFPGGAYSVALQSDGRIIVAGYSYSGSSEVFALARFTTNGAWDNSFGVAGRVTVRVGSRDQAYSVALQSDGKIVLAGTTGFTVGSSYFALVRLLADDAGPLLRIRSSAPGQAIVSWAPNSPGFVLQESSLLSPTSWSNAPSGVDNPAQIDTSDPTKIYRLHKP